MILEVSCEESTFAWFLQACTLSCFDLFNSSIWCIRVFFPELCVPHAISETRINSGTGFCPCHQPFGSFARVSASALVSSSIMQLCCTTLMAMNAPLTALGPLGDESSLTEWENHQIISNLISHAFLAVLRLHLFASRICLVDLQTHREQVSFRSLGIGFHKDKTLDLDEQAPIVSISLGRPGRPYILRDNIFQPTQQSFGKSESVIMGILDESEQYIAILYIYIYISLYIQYIAPHFTGKCCGCCVQNL